MALARRRRVALRSSGGRGLRTRRRHSTPPLLGQNVGQLTGKAGQQMRYPRPLNTQRRQCRRGILEALFLMDGGPELLEAAHDRRQTVQRLLQLVSVLTAASPAARQRP